MAYHIKLVQGLELKMIVVLISYFEGELGACLPLLWRMQRLPFNMYSFFHGKWRLFIVEDLSGMNTCYDSVD